MHNIVNNLGFAQVINPQTIQATALNSGNLDTQGVETLCAVIMVGNIVDTLDATHRIDLKIEHADDDGTGNPAAYVACTDSDVLNFTGLNGGIFKAVSAAGDKNKRYAINYLGTRRFVKITATPVGLVTGGPVAMLAVRGNHTQRPTVNV